MQASKSACKNQKNVVILHRVRQLKRTELAWRVDTTTKNNKNNYLWKTISTMFRGNQLPAAAKEYKNQQQKQHKTNNIPLANAASGKETQYEEKTYSFIIPFYLCCLQSTISR